MDDATPDSTEPTRQRGIQSIEVGGRLLTALAHHGRPMALKDLAASAGMVAAKAHPYLVSFGQLGLIAQDEASGHYGLGPLAMQLGLISLQQFEPLTLASPVIEALASALGLTLALAVWGTHGATIVRVAHPPSPVHISLRHGTVMSLQGTATGRLFAAWLPHDTVEPLWRAETKSKAAAAASRTGTLEPAEPSLESLRRQVRRDGLGLSQGLSMPGIHALAVPVFDATGQLVLALTAIGPQSLLPADPCSENAERLKSEAAKLSRRLGCSNPAGSPTA